MDAHIHFDHLRGSAMIAYMRFDEIATKSITIKKISQVLCRVEDVNTFDGEPYEIYHVDCIMSDGSVKSFDNVLDVIIE